MLQYRQHRRLKHRGGPPPNHLERKPSWLQFYRVSSQIGFRTRMVPRGRLSANNLKQQQRRDDVRSAELLELLRLRAIERPQYQQSLGLDASALAFLCQENLESTDTSPSSD